MAMIFKTRKRRNSS